jgi:hypothetical protein
VSFTSREAVEVDGLTMKKDSRRNLDVVDDNSSSLDEKKRLTQRQEIISVSSQVHQL